jgi:alkylmercury lyase
MKNPNLAEIAKALREFGIPPRFEPGESRLLIQLWRLVAGGRPVSLKQVEEIASSLQIPRDAAMSFIGKVSERDVKGNVVGIFGLSQKGHPHRFEVTGHTLSTWCAWDTLFLPAMLNQIAKVESSCPSTKQTIRLTITPQKVEEIEPSNSVISIVVPEVTKRGLEAVEEIWMTFCRLVHFFSSTEAASEWISAMTQDIHILSAEAAYQLGLMAFEDFRKYL